MLRAVRAGGQTFCPWSLILHCQMVRRHLAKDTAASSVPMVKGMMHSAPGTSSSRMPWTANWSQHIILKVGSMVSSVSSSSPMSTWYSVPCPGLPLEDSGFPSVEHQLPLSSHYTTWQASVCGIWKSSSNPSSSSKEARTIPSLE